MKPTNGELFQLVEIRLWILHLLAEETDKILQGTKPGASDSIQLWDLENWERDDVFWLTNFPQLCRRLQQLIRPRPLAEAISLFPGGFELELGTYRRLPADEFPNRWAKLDRPPLGGSRTPVRVSVLRYEFDRATAGPWADQFDPGNMPKLVDRDRFFYLNALLEILNDGRGGMILLSSEQIEDLGITKNNGPARIYTAHLGFLTKNP